MTNVVSTDHRHSWPWTLIDISSWTFSFLLKCTWNVYKPAPSDHCWILKFWTYGYDCAPHVSWFTSYFYMLLLRGFERQHNQKETFYILNIWDPFELVVLHAANDISKKMHVLERRTVSALTRGLFWCLFPEVRSNEGNKHQNSTRVSAETVRHESTYIILFLTRQNEFTNCDKNDDLYTSSPYLTCSVFVLLMTSQPIADDVIMTWQLWRDHVNNDIQLVRYRFYSRRYSRPVA